MKDFQYIYVIGMSIENEPHGIALEDFEMSVEIWSGVRFNPEDIEEEVSKESFRSIFKHGLRWDILKKIMEE